MIVLVFALSLAAGTYLGYRYAVESKRLDAVIAETVARLDLTPEDEAEETPASPFTAIPSWAKEWDSYSNHAENCQWCRK